jgi:hypothetical protein
MRFLTNILAKAGLIVDGTTQLNTIANATVDTDKFLVSDNGVVKYRTGVQIISDIGALSSSAVSGTTNYIPKFTSSNTLGNSVIQESSNNIGIGISSSGGKLEVNGVVRIYDNLYLTKSTSYIYGGDQSGRLVLANNTTNANITIFGINNGNNISLTTNASITFSAGTGSAERMRVDSSGNLGLGTFGPSYRVDVVRTGSGIQDVLSLDNYFQNTGVVDGVRVNIRGFRIEASSTYGSADNKLTFGFGVNKDFTLTQSGNCGLGVTPSAWWTSGKAIQVGTNSSFSDLNGDLHVTDNAFYNGTNWIAITTNIASNYHQSAGAHVWRTASSTTAGNTISWTQVMNLTTGGNLTITGTLTEQSAIKYKENIVPIQDALGKVEQLKPVSYNKKGSETKEIGLIAEDVFDVYPEFVLCDDDGQPLGVHYSRLTAVLIESVKELKKEINQLKSKS